MWGEYVGVDDVSRVIEEDERRVKVEWGVGVWRNFRSNYGGYSRGRDKSDDSVREQGRTGVLSFAIKIAQKLSDDTFQIPMNLTKINFIVLQTF